MAKNVGWGVGRSSACHIKRHYSLLLSRDRARSHITKKVRRHGKHQSRIKREKWNALFVQEIGPTIPIRHPTQKVISHLAIKKDESRKLSGIFFTTDGHHYLICPFKKVQSSKPPRFSMGQWKISDLSYPLLKCAYLSVFKANFIFWHGFVCWRHRRSSWLITGWSPSSISPRGSSSNRDLLRKQ